jgi:hypothetical protein
MTLRQEASLRKKISDIRAVLAVEKRKFGGYFDNRGLRYAPPAYFIRLHDYKAGLRYVRWFWRSFPDDEGYPLFLFECAIIFYYAAKPKEAGTMIKNAHANNPLLLDAFFGKTYNLPPGSTPQMQWHWEQVQDLPYLYTQPELTTFANWLQKTEEAEKVPKGTNG